MLKPVINLGRQPQHANGYLTKEQLGTEKFFEMVIGYDPENDAIKLMEPCSRELMFNDQYAFYSKTSNAMRKHFADTALKLKKYIKGGVVVEVGSNDGIMQDAWRDMGITCIGVEPSGNVADIAIENGHKVIKDFVGNYVVEELKEYGKIDLVYAANVSCHITEFDEYLKSVKELIGQNGVFVFEDPYFLDVYEKCSYDQFYGEHTWMFTVKFIQNKLKEHGLKLLEVEHLWTHGGSMRYYVTDNPNYYLSSLHMKTQEIEAWKEKEGDIELKLEELAKRIETSRISLKELLKDLQGRIAGFGATSKGVVVTNYCGIGADLIPFITDTTPTKIGKYYPGSHIPIVSQKETDYSQIDYLVCFAWNHFEEIKKLDLGFKGKWIIHVPFPHIDDSSI